MPKLSKLHIFWLVVIIAVLILLIAPHSGAADGIRAFVHGLLNLIGQIFDSI